MQAKILFFISISVLSINGCYFGPVPEDISDTTWTINSELIEKIVRDQSVPGRISRIKGKTIVIHFKNDICPCVKNRLLRIRVSEANSKVVKGYEKHPDRASFYGVHIVDSALCQTFATANEVIFGAELSSKNPPNFFPPSYNLIWEAQRALGPPECDSIRAKILAEKAKQIAEDEGAKLLGYDITGTWGSKMTSNHPDYFNKKEQRNLKLTIDERANQITVTDSSGKAALEAYRTEGFLYPTTVKLKFSFPVVSINQLEGRWEVIDGSTIEGSWSDPITSASGKWNLWKMGREIKAVKSEKNLVKHRRKWLSRAAPLEIKWEEIEMIQGWTKEIDWMWCLNLWVEAPCWNKYGKK